MSKPVLLLDVDGVLANFVLAVRRGFRALGYKPTFKVTKWDFVAGLTPAERTTYEAVVNAPGFAAQMPACPNVPYTKLRELAEVYAVTSPVTTSKTWCYDRQQWLIKHGFDKHHIIFASGESKHLVSGDYFVDDNLETVVRWSEHDMHTRSNRGILWPRAYNRAVLTQQSLFDSNETWDTLLARLQA